MSRDILISLIDPDPDQPRKHFDEASLKELAQSIKANGLAVPILLRPNGERFIIVHGERRYRAVRLLNWESIPAEVRDIDPDGAKWLALVENVQRNDLGPIEEAMAYQARLSEGLTQEQLGQRIGKTQSYIATKLRFLKLPQPIQDQLNIGAITEGHAKQLLRLKDENEQSFIGKAIIDSEWGVREVKAYIDGLLLPVIGKYRQLFPGLLPPLAGQEYVAFRNSIAEFGVLVPVHIDEHNGVIDGWQRLRAAQELGILDTVAFYIHPGLTKAEKLSLVISLNMIRQHFNSSQLAVIQVQGEQLERVIEEAKVALEALPDVESSESLEELLHIRDTADHWARKIAEARLRGDREVRRFL